jgi:hypothetical protein
MSDYEKLAIVIARALPPKVASPKQSLLLTAQKKLDRSRSFELDFSGRNCIDSEKDL